MSQEFTQPELPLMAGAVALGAVCAMVAVLLLFPIIDRFIRPKFDLERGSAMVVLLGASLLIGTVGGTFGYFYLRDREADAMEERSGEQAGLLLKVEERAVATSVILTRTGV